ncbi:MAG: response regulator [Pseudomonadota bacterium]
MKFSKALVVDDSKVVRIKLGRTLEAHGLTVEAVGSGPEALEYLKSHTPDLVFMDFMMPDMDGFQATRIILSDPATSSIPVIMCTGQDTAEDRARAVECGASGFLTKPIEDDALLSLLTALQEKAAAPKPIPIPAPLPPEDIVVEEIQPAPEPVNAAQIDERAAGEITERIIREAIAAATAAAQQASREAAQAVATAVVQDALDRYRAENTKTQERAEQAAAAIAERIARQTLDTAPSIAENAARQIMESGRLDLQTMVQQVAQSAARVTAEEISRDALQSIQEQTSAAHDSNDTAVLTAAELTSRKVAQEIARAVVADALAVYRAEAKVEEQSEQVIAAAAEQAAQNVVRKSLDAVPGIAENSARQMIDSMRADFLAITESAAESATKRANEAVAQAMAEQMATVSEKQVATPNDGIERIAVAAVERVVREMTQEALKDVAGAGRQAATSVVNNAMQTLRALGDEQLRQTVESVTTAAKKIAETSAHERVEAAAQKHKAGSVSLLSPKMLFPWLAGLTLVVLYLLFKSF